MLTIGDGVFLGVIVAILIYGLVQLVRSYRERDVRALLVDVGEVKVRVFVNTPEQRTEHDFIFRGYWNMFNGEPWVHSAHEVARHFIDDEEPVNLGRALSGKTVMTQPGATKGRFISRRYIYQYQIHDAVPCYRMHSDRGKTPGLIVSPELAKDARIYKILEP